MSIYTSIKASTTIHHNQIDHFRLDDMFLHYITDHVVFSREFFFHPSKNYNSLKKNFLLLSDSELLESEM